MPKGIFRNPEERSRKISEKLKKYKRTEEHQNKIDESQLKEFIK